MGRRLRRAILFGVGLFATACGGCDRDESGPAPVFVAADDGRTSSDRDGTTPQPGSVIESDGSAAGDTLLGDADASEEAPSRVQRLIAPEGLDHVILRVGFPLGRMCSNVLYEGNNPAMRGRRLPSGVYEARGEAIATRWQEAAAAGRGIFVLRDTLFSQQDHPLDHEALALMMPPSWVTSAVVEVREGRTPTAPRAPAVDDDGAWARLDTPSKMFGSFPQSDALFGWARGETTRAPPASRSRIENARRAIRTLAASAQAMIDVASRGVEAVANVGAEQIAASDRAYFGEELRRERVIVISVENPNEHEVVDEGKGFRPHKTTANAETLEPSVRLVTDAVLRRRLADGDLALERYDLTQPSDRSRAIALLERLIPSSGQRNLGGHKLWLWVNGRLDASGVHGDDATVYIEDFRQEVSRADVDVSRLGYVSKPHIDLPRGKARSKALREEAARLRSLGLPLSVNLTTSAFTRLIED